ncbi:PREDICTED: RPW8-like protein 3 [Camelina sativa]|uniref:RPW8-like protein 3 n=1 Tax=Camelina sativa TaxID=90675 RepID=A0ABM0ZGI7_CAMSA|nr:PREDICTED: RPW8-like protein 3 [Camelina sativa]
MSVVEIVAGPALGYALQALHYAIKRAIDRSLTSAYIFDRLDATIFKITTLVAQVDKLSEEVEDPQRKVIEDLKHLLEKAVSLVEAYAELRRRNLLKKFRYKRRIKELEASLRWMVNVDVQVNQWVDIKELMAKMSEMNTKFEENTRQPTNFMCFKSSHSISQQSSNEDIVEETDQSSEETAECSSDGSKPKIDIQIRWSSRKQNKDHEIRFVMK